MADLDGFGAEVGKNFKHYVSEKGKNLTLDNLKEYRSEGYKLDIFSYEGKIGDLEIYGTDSIVQEPCIIFDGKKFYSFRIALKAISEKLT